MDLIRRKGKASSVIILLTGMLWVFAVCFASENQLPRRPQEKAATIKLLWCDPVPLPAVPGKPPWVWYQKIANTVAGSGTTIDFACLPETYFMNSTTPYTTAYNGIGMVAKACEAENKEYDAFLIGCGHEPGLTSCRALLDIPVLGPLESATHVACMLGNKFSVITLDPSWCAVLDAHIKGYGLEDKLASIRCPSGLSFDQAISMIFGKEKDQKKFVKLITSEMSKTVDEDGAEALIAACTLASSLLTMHHVHSVKGAPVIDLVATQVAVAEAMVKLHRAYEIGVCNASIYHPPPPGWQKEVPISTK